jgi:carbon-monoxide dehydrogenase medium subunit
LSRGDFGTRASSCAAAALADADTEPGEDHQASRDYRRHLASVLTRRALERAAVN